MNHDRRFDNGTAAQLYVREQDFESELSECVENASAPVCVVYGDSYRVPSLCIGNRWEDGIDAVRSALADLVSSH